MAGEKPATDEDDFDLKILDEPETPESEADTAAPEAGDDTDSDAAPAKADASDNDPDEDHRLREERKHRKRAEAELAKRDALITKLAERLDGIEGNVNSLNGARLEIAEKTVAQGLEQARAAKAKAREEGDAAREFEVDEQIYELRRQKDQIAHFKAQAKNRQPAASRDEPAGDAAAESGLSREARSWVSKNAWFDMAGDDEHSLVAKQISAALLKAGYAVDDPKHFEELDKRMSRYAPELYRGQGKQGRPTASAAAPSSRGSADRAPNKSPTVPKNLVDNFRSAGFDVNDPKVKRKIWDSYQATLKNNPHARKA